MKKGLVTNNRKNEEQHRSLRHACVLPCRGTFLAVFPGRSPLKRSAFFGAGDQENRVLRFRHLLISAVLATILAGGMMAFSPTHHAAAAAAPSHQETIFSFVGQELFGGGMCTNETVLVTSGDIKFDVDTTIAADGGMNIQTVATHRDVKGIGETTGAAYEFVGTNHSGFHADGATVEDETFSIHVITSGPGNNLVLREEFHITVNADGTTTAIFDHSVFECV